MASKLHNTYILKSLVYNLSKNHHTLQRGLSRNLIFNIQKSHNSFLSSEYHSLSYISRHRSSFFKSKENEGKHEEPKESKNENTDGSKKEESHKEEKADSQKKPEQKTPETIENLIEDASPEIKKKIMALWKKLQDENSHCNKRTKELSDQISNLEKVNSDHRQKLVDMRDRLKEELDERDLMRTRFDKEMENMKSFAITKFAKDLLEIPDNLDRALETAKDLEGKGNSLYEGVKATKNILHHVLEKHGIKQLNPKGEKFDPNQHEALFDYPDPNSKAGTVGTVCTVGYKIQDRVLRPAKVGIVRSE